MKKIINSTDTIVNEMCLGMEKAHPDMIKYTPKYKIVQRKTLNPDKVTLICGGGSGHEPAHAGYVGVGMLDAAVCGDVFASPSSVQVYNAIKNTASSKGTLLIVKNYSGDCMNFDTAAEMAEEDDDIKVERVYVNDDIAVKDSLYTIGRRGVAGTVLVEKIAGAAAEEGLSLEEVKAVAQKAIDSVRSIGFALTSCTVPAKGSPTFELGEGEIEFGVGIHGEPGIERRPVGSSQALTNEMIQMLLADLNVVAEDEVVLLVNGLGASPLQELYVMSNDAHEALKTAGVKVYKTMVGNFMTAIDMAGASLTILKLDDELKKYYNSPVNTIALKML